MLVSEGALTFSIFVYILSARVNRQFRCESSHWLVKQPQTVNKDRQHKMKSMHLDQPLVTGCSTGIKPSGKHHFR